VQRWEYKVVSLPDGRYTEMLNELGRDGWELVEVAADVHDVPPRARGRGRSVPMPRAIGTLQDAASTAWSKVDPADDDGPAPGSTTTTLLWILRRPLAEG
jgi:hypothetical protein